MKPMVLMIGADKGGVGKTTIARTMLDYLAARNTLTRAFDSRISTRNSQAVPSAVWRSST